MKLARNGQPSPPPLISQVYAKGEAEKGRRSLQLLHQQHQPKDISEHSSLPHQITTQKQK